MNACRLNNDYFLREMPPASSRAAVLGILTADITDLPISLCLMFLLRAAREELK